METWHVDGSAIEIPTREIYRYMGYRGVQPDDAVASRVAACTAQLAARSTPRSVWTSYPYSLTDPSGSPEQGQGAPTAAPSASPSASNQDTMQATPGNQSALGASPQLTIGPLTFESRALSRNLRDCSRVVMMAATIGPGVDFLIRRAEATSMVDAAIYQAAGAAMVEAWCDMVNERIKENLLPQGLYARPRFSPGYGDVPLALQRDFAQVLNLSKNCGISLTDTLLMTPSKSVTAFIGFSRLEERCPLAGCEVCNKSHTCAYRR